MFTLKPLPYAKNALEPHISEKTLSFHYDKHHQGYCNKLNELMRPSYADKSLEDVILLSHSDNNMPIFNNAAQVWNHTFFWDSMKPDGGGSPDGQLLSMIESDFGSYEEFRQQFHAAGVTQFGSGWAWLVQSNGKLEIMKTGNADTPMVHGKKAILTCDVWEHAYYLDYQNRRPDYISIFLDNLVNWDFVSSNLDLS